MALGTLRETGEATGRGNGGPTHRVLVAGSEPDLNAAVAYHLARAGYRVSTVVNGLEAIDTVREERPTLIVLDATLVGLSGFELLAQLRQREETRDVGVLFLTERDREPDRIKGLALGADDCLSKPCSAEELVLRVRAITRRLAAPGVTSGGRLSVGPIVLDRTAHRVLVHGDDVKLTATEFKLLRTLMQREGRVQSRAELLETVWGAPSDVTTRTVDMHLQRLRHKLGDAGLCIETVRSAGYRFQRLKSAPGTHKRERRAKDA
jgi:two-component system phosphate regulon response regulator PhoB